MIFNLNLQNVLRIDVITDTQVGSAHLAKIKGGK